MAQPQQTQPKKEDDDTPVVVATVTRNPSQPLRRSTRNRKEADTASAVSVLVLLHYKLLASSYDG